MPVMLTHDTSVDYDVQGSGPPLLLIDGLGFGRWCWFKQTPSSRATCAPSPSTSAASIALPAA